MTDNIHIYCSNNQTYYDVPRGIRLLDLYQSIGLQLPYPLVAARVNYKVKRLDFALYKAKDIEFLDVSTHGGMRCYVQTLLMVMACAVKQLHADYDLRIEHPISNGCFCTIRDQQGKKITIDKNYIQALRSQMRDIVAQDIPIQFVEAHRQEMIQAFREQGRDTTLFETMDGLYCHYYQMGDYIDYYGGKLMPSTGYLNVFEVEPYLGDILLRIPNGKNPNQLEDKAPQEKRFKIFNEFKDWNQLLGIDNVGEFNKACKKQRSFELIKISEAMHEKKISQIADTITQRTHIPRLVLIAGPSSSGKTTFSKRLRIQLLVNGLKPVTISLDNYFVNRDQTPLDENGDWDFEHLHALDLPFFQQQMKDLLEGKEVDLPTYNFEKGQREFRGDKLQLQPGQVCILEGLHALNPELTQGVDSEDTFKIFVNVMTTVNLDNHNWIPTTDARLIRRIVRDYRYRAYSAKDTIARFDSVRRGEEKWIYPFQEEADAMFNSTLLFELAVFKHYAMPILSEVPRDCDEYTDAYRLMKELSYFESIPEREIPPTSFLREFVGGSSFRY